MRRLSSYIRKYGPDEGRRLYTVLQREAAHARWKAFWKKRAAK